MATRPFSSRLPGLLFVLALASTLPILWRVVWPIANGANWPEHGGHLPIVLVHATGGLCMLLLGAAALYIGWTKKAFRRHKWFGYAYLTLGGTGALAALIVSVQSPHAPHSLYIATGTLACVWLAVAAMALRAARNRRFDSHREWMIRSFVLTWTFVGCRLATMVDFYPWLGPESTTAAIWVNWIVPLIACEFALRWTDGAKVSANAGRGGTGAAAPAAPTRSG
jgi:uncharacterized membrane protein YozB (DUF420 family)